MPPPTLYSAVNAQETTGGSCEAFPRPGIEVQVTDEGDKIIAVGAATPFGNDASSINDALEEATLEAKSRIVQFLQEELSKDSSVDRVAKEQVKVSGKAKQMSKDQITNRLRSLHSHAQALLKGVAVLGDCYTKGEEVRVAVGIKPETLAVAERLAEGTSAALSGGSSTMTESNAPDSEGPKGFSNRSKLDQF